MKNGKYSKRRGVATKAMVMILSLMLVVGLSVGGTLAWLTATSGTVTNEFTVGDINITLAETTGEDYKIIPGGKDSKDPTLTVAKESEKCYVYVSVENNVKIGDTVVATPNIDASKWIQVGTSGNKTVYRYYEVVDASAAAVELAVFTEVSYSPDITKANIEALTGKTIVINGYAHQSDNTTETVATAAANTHFGITAA